jgi:hypothetical protein
MVENVAVRLLPPNKEVGGLNSLSLSLSLSPSLFPVMSAPWIVTDLY